MDMADIMEDMVMEITEVMGDMVNNTNQKEKNMNINLGYGGHHGGHGGYGHGGHHGGYGGHGGHGKRSIFL